MSPQIKVESPGSHSTSQEMTQDVILPRSIEPKTSTSATSPFATHLEPASTVDNQHNAGVNCASATHDATPTKAIINDGDVSGKNVNLSRNASSPNPACQSQNYSDDMGFSVGRTIIAVAVAILIFGSVITLFLCVGMRGRKKASERQPYQQSQLPTVVVTPPTARRRGEGITQSNITQPFQTYQPPFFYSSQTSRSHFSESGQIYNSTPQDGPTSSSWSQTTLGTTSGAPQNSYWIFGRVQDQPHRYPPGSNRHTRHIPQLLPQEGTGAGRARRTSLLPRISFLRLFSTYDPTAEVRSATSPDRRTPPPDHTPTPYFSSTHDIQDDTQYPRQSSSSSFSDPLPISSESTDHDHVVSAAVDYNEPIMPSSRVSIDLDLETPRNWEVGLPDVNLKSKSQDAVSNVEQLHTPPRSPSPA